MRQTSPLGQSSGTSSRLSLGVEPEAGRPSVLLPPTWWPPRPLPVMDGPTIEPVTESEKGTGDGVRLLLLGDLMTRILDVDGPDVGCDLPQVITDHRSEAAGAADAEHRHGQFLLREVSVGDHVGREGSVVIQSPRGARPVCCTRGHRSPPAHW